MSRESLKSLSPWFQMPRNILLEMGGGGQTTKSTYAKRGGEYQAYVCVRGGGGSNFSQFRAYVLIE